MAWNRYGTSWTSLIGIILLVLGLFIVFSYIWSWAIWWALTYFHIITNPWNTTTWIAPNSYNN